MFIVSREFSFCYGHRLLNHQGKCAHPHGHNGIIRIFLKNNELNSQGMVVDFGDLKRSIGVWIDENLDHQMILDRNDPLVPILKKMKEPIFLMDSDPTAENLAKLIYEQAEKMGISVHAVEFWETEKCCAEFRSEDK